MDTPKPNLNLNLLNTLDLPTLVTTKQHWTLKIVLPFGRSFHDNARLG